MVSLILILAILSTLTNFYNLLVTQYFLILFCLARRDVPVVAISGDGGALFAITELATAVHHNIPLTTVIFNDHAFGNVRRLQMDNYDNRLIASDLSSPDFASLARSFGAQGLMASNPEDLRNALEVAIAHDGPSVIEVPVGELPSPWDFVLMPKVRG